MGSFNFYINVDQCLNMSNFDMFFYKLQSEHKFHLSNVQFFEDEGKNSLKEAFYEIRNYIDKSSFLIQDYRLIFGIRESRKKAAETRWQDTILYRLLKIYFGLLDARIFIKSKDSVDKNVSVIMLYDADFTFDEKDLDRDGYDFTGEIEVLMNYLGIDWKPGITDWELEDRFRQILNGMDGIFQVDAVTCRFLSAFLEWHCGLAVPETEEEIWQDKETYEEQKILEQMFAQDDPEQFLAEKRKRNKPNIHNKLNDLFTFVQSCVGHYCVFRKEINKNSMSQNVLSLLSIVDYITSDLKLEGKDEKIRNNDTLKEKSRLNWEQATNDTGIQKRYGTMLLNYKSRLQNKLNQLEQTLVDFSRGEPAPKYTQPGTLTGDKGLLTKDKKEYTDEFHKILDQFLKKSIRKDIAQESWTQAYQELKEKLNQMEEELQIFARDLSRRYKLQMEERKSERLKSGPKTDVRYSQENISETLEQMEKKKEKLLEKLRKPKMNPSLTFQDQLNLENTLEQCNLEVRFFVKCHKMIQIANFFLLVLLGGGLYALHYFLMQSYAFSNVEMLFAFLMYLGVSFVLFMTVWNAPYYYFKAKIRKSMAVLKEQMELFINGYFEKAENFSEYINTINELDAVNGYIGKLHKIRDKAALEARKRLWHKVQIQEHIRKSGYFENMLYTLDSSEKQDCSSRDCELNFDENVIKNRLYWPQWGCEVQEGEK